MRRSVSLNIPGSVRTASSRRRCREVVPCPPWPPASATVRRHGPRLRSGSIPALRRDGGRPAWHRRRKRARAAAIRARHALATPHPACGDAQPVTKAPHGSVPGERFARAPLRSAAAFSHRSCGGDCPYRRECFRERTRLHAATECAMHCPARAAPAAGVPAPRYASKRECRRCRHDGPRAIVFRYLCNLFACPNFFVRT